MGGDARGRTRLHSQLPSIVYSCSLQPRRCTSAAWAAGCSRTLCPAAGPGARACLCFLALADGRIMAADVDLCESHELGNAALSQQESRPADLSDHLATTTSEAPGISCPAACGDNLAVAICSCVRGFTEGPSACCSAACTISTCRPSQSTAWQTPLGWLAGPPQCLGLAWNDMTTALHA